MNERLDELMRERDRLRRDIEAGRNELRAVGHDLRRPLRQASQLRDRFANIAHRAMFLLPPLAVLLLLRPRRTLHLVAAALSAWRIYHQIRAVLAAHDHGQRALPAPPATSRPPPY